MPIFDSGTYNHRSAVKLMMEMEGEEPGEESQHLQVSFFTKQEKYSIPDAPYSLPSAVSPNELNDIVQKVLFQDESDDDDGIEFDFLINGEFLRSSLADFFDDKNISHETVVEIEYVERAQAPRPETSLAHDDWVSCVRGSNDLILTGCYDNTLRLWTREEKCILTVTGHSAPIKCVSWINQTDLDDSSLMFASGSHDQTLCVWKYSRPTKELDCLFACRGHAGSVDCVTVHEDGQRIVTGSWDKTIKLWSAATQDLLSPNENQDDEEEGQKRKKLKSSGQKVATKVPLLTLSNHKEAVSSVVWMDDSSVASASWDHTLRVWDMSSSQETAIWEGSKAFFSISHSNLSNLIVSASADRHVRLHDLRTKELSGTFTSHTGWVSSVHWSQIDRNLFISGSHDMVMKLWDVRSPKAPMYNLIGQEEKILAVDWSIPDLMLSGGADNQLKLFSYQSSLSNQSN